MSICRFCEREFANAQAVRAHLKGCAAYLSRPRKPDPALPNLREDPLGSASLLGTASREGSPGSGTEFDPVRQLEQRLATEQLRLKLREVQEAHQDLDLREQAREEQRLRKSKKQADSMDRAAREQEAARAREQLALGERQQKQDAQQRLQARRRELIQSVKHEVIERWVQRFSASDPLKAQILQQMELALTRLAIDELPQEELLQIAQGVRDQLWTQAMEVQQNALRQAQQRQSLAQYGLEYATRELARVAGLDVLTRWRIEMRVQDELKHVSAQETKAEIEDRVEAILEDEGLEFDDELGAEQDD